MQSRKYNIDTVFMLILFAIFVMCVLSMSVIAVNIYSRGSVLASENYNVRTSVLYVAEKARQHNLSGNIRIDNALGSDALVLSETINDKEYETWIYAIDGNLSEVTVPVGTEIIPYIGQAIMPLESMGLKLDSKSVLTIEVIDEHSKSYSYSIFLQTIRS